MKRKLKQLGEIFLTGLIMAVGIFLLKFLPMKIFGKDILFDASLHITLACFFLYLFYFFVDQNKNLRIFYFFFAFMVLTVISVQRIIAGAHNDIGILAGIFISVLAIMIPRWKEIGKKIDF